MYQCIILIRCIDLSKYIYIIWVLVLDTNNNFLLVVLQVAVGPKLFWKARVKVASIWVSQEQEPRISCLLDGARDNLWISVICWSCHFLLHSMLNCNICSVSFYRNIVSYMIIYRYTCASYTYPQIFLRLCVTSTTLVLSMNFSMPSQGGIRAWWSSTPPWRRGIGVLTALAGGEGAQQMDDFLSGFRTLWSNVVAKHVCGATVATRTGN